MFTKSDVIVYSLLPLQLLQHSTIVTLENVAFAMHCNLRPPDVATDILGFNYEAHDRTSASLATCQICLILLLVLHVSVMYLSVFGE